MALASNYFRSVLPSPRLFSQSLPLAWSLFTRPTFAWAPLPFFHLVLPSPSSLLELIPPFLLAVPKKKVSHSRKAMRASNKGLNDKNNIVSCPGCGSPKLAHHLCPQCYSQISRGYKREAREMQAQETSANSLP